MINNDCKTSNNGFDLHNSFTIFNEPRFLHNKDKCSDRPRIRTHRKAIIDAGIQAGIFDINQNEQDPNIDIHFPIIARNLITTYYSLGNDARFDEINCEISNLGFYANQNLVTLSFSVYKALEYINYYKSEEYCENNNQFKSQYNFNFNIIYLNGITFYSNNRMLTGTLRRQSELVEEYNRYFSRRYSYGYGSGYYPVGKTDVSYTLVPLNNLCDKMQFIQNASINQITLRGIFLYGNKLKKQNDVLLDADKMLCNIECLENEGLKRELDFICDLNSSDYTNLIAKTSINIKNNLGKEITQTNMKVATDASNNLSKTTHSPFLYC